MQTSRRTALLATLLAACSTAPSETAHPEVTAVGNTV